MARYRGYAPRRQALRLIIVFLLGVLCCLAVVSLAKALPRETIQKVSDTLKPASSPAIQVSVEPTEQKGGEQSELKSLTQAEIQAQGTLVVVNARNLWPESYTPDLVTISDVRPANLVGLKNVDMRANAEALEAMFRMFQDAKADGVDGYTIVSSYRGYDKQAELFEERVQEVMQLEGLNREDGETRANQTVALPGQSEHHTGLAFDLTVGTGDLHEFVTSPEYDWLEEHCWEYGFIIRYPADKSDITDINNEPWHYRYVGLPHSQKIHDQKLCLEEYVQKQ